MSLYVLSKPLSHNVVKSPNVVVFTIQYTACMFVISMVTSTLARATLQGAQPSTGNYRHYRRADPCQVDFRTLSGSKIWALLVRKV